MSSPISSPDPSKISLEFKNFLGQKKQVTLKDLETWQKGKGENFFVRSLKQVRTLFSPNIVVTDARVKDMMKRMDPNTMKQITDTFQQALNEPNKDPQMLALARTLSKVQGSIGKKSEASTPKEIKQVYDLRQVVQAGAAAKVLEDNGIEVLLKSAILEGMMNNNDAGFKGTGISGDFIKFYENTSDKTDINQIFKDFIQHTIDEGKNGKDLRDYPKDKAFVNYKIYSALSKAGLEKNPSFEQVNNKNVAELVGDLDKQINRQNINLQTLANAKAVLVKPEEMTKERALKLIQNPVSRPMMQEIFKAAGKEGEAIDQHLDSCVELLKYPELQPTITNILSNYPKERPVAISLKELLLKKELNHERLDDLISNPQTKPIIKELFEFVGRGKDFQIHERYLKSDSIKFEDADEILKAQNSNLEFIQDLANQFKEPT